jgi:hypothetical protein
MSKSKERKPLKETGQSLVGYKYFDDRVTIDFSIDRIIDGNLKSNFSEMNIINFDANSYRVCCLTLLKNMTKYKDAQTYSEKEYFASMYLPAMFCFRHYIELKLKFLYMYFCKETFTPTHDLNTLLADLKNNSDFTLSVFDEPIDYINNVEQFMPDGKVEVAYFRYLCDLNFEWQKHLEIPMFEHEKIRQYILNIENRVLSFIQNKFVNGLASESDNYKPT